MNLHRKTIIGTSLLIGALVALISLVGIYAPDFYSRETSNWQIQAAAQDIIDLVMVVPALMVAALLTFSNKKAASALWSGVLLYLVYTLAIYCFDVHFNSLFPVYCLLFGIVGYAFLYSLLGIIQESIEPTGLVFKIIGLYFIVVSVLFYLLWLSEIIPAAWMNTVPQSLVEVGLPTNPVHVLDLAFVLPGIFVVGLLILKKRPIGITLAPVVLTFFILMDITIAAIMVMMVRNGFEGSYAIAIFMALLAILSLGLLTWYIQYTWTYESK